MTGAAPRVCDALPRAAILSQWSNVARVIGRPATTATSWSGIGAGTCAAPALTRTVAAAQSATKMHNAQARAVGIRRITITSEAQPTRFIRSRPAGPG